MHALLTRLRRRLSFANVTSTVALFVALGGTSYAAISVGSAQIRTGAVGKSEIRTGAVGKSEVATNAIGRSEIAKDGVDTAELKDGGIGVADLSAATRSALGLSRASVTKSGAAAGGNAKSVVHAAGTGVYTVEFDRDVSACTAGATLAAVKNGTATDEPVQGRVSVAAGDANTKVVVNTFVDDATTHLAAPGEQPFTLLVAC